MKACTKTLKLDYRQRVGDALIIKVTADILLQVNHNTCEMSTTRRGHLFRWGMIPGIIGACSEKLP